MSELNPEQTDFSKSVTAVVIREGKVLLGRHTYGPGKGLLIVPGGYITKGEDPRDAVKREYLEETGVVIDPKEVIGIRFNEKDWYVAFRADYVSGEASPQDDENEEVIWLGVAEALEREDVPGLTKTLIEAALSEKPGLTPTEFFYTRGKGGMLYAHGN